MIKVIGRAPESDKYEFDSFDNFLSWIKTQTIYQLDIETNVTPYWSTKKLITIQFGDYYDMLQWVIQVSELSQYQLTQLKEVLEDPTKQKLFHNGVFEYTVLRFNDITLENVYDTMLAEQVLSAGMYDIPDGHYALKDLVSKYLAKTISKEEQTTFGDNELTEDKVVYAAGDVRPMGAIHRMQMTELTHHDLDWVMALENEVLLTYGDMTYEGLELDQVAWRKNITLVQPLIDGAIAKLNAWLLDPEFNKKAQELGYISNQDRVEIKWTSPRTRETILRWIFPDVPGGSLGVVKKYMKAMEINGVPQILLDYVNKDYNLLEQTVLLTNRQELIDNDWLIPAGQVTINWSSQAQVLPLFRTFSSKLRDLSAESRAKLSHPIVADYEEYKDNMKLTGSYGEDFITKFVEPDGKVHSSYRQILSTGRVANAHPNMQQIPAKKSVGSRYRNAFVAPEGWMFVDSDYSSQELNIIAYLSKDPVWNDALQKGQDLHSVAAEVVYGPKWKAAAEESCAYYANGAKVKCHCKKHEVMRQNVKSINFGLAYGMGEMKLSGELKITLQEATLLIDDYFTKFPSIYSLLTYLGNFGVRNGYSMTMAPFFRKRWYPYWSLSKQYIDAHISGIEYNHTLGAIERAAKNAPIQGTGADMLKYAGILIRRYIRDQNLSDSIRQVVHVHDQITTIAKKEIAEWWKTELTRLMEEAALAIIPNGMLKAETNVNLVWSK
jgi:DNA polymerase I-like protein with 3'-5' exonuclease and polymerase domains